jgi:hypothetical protein
MNFQETYSRAAYLDFFRNILLPDDFEQTDEIIPLTAQADRIKQVVKIGEVPSLDLPVFEIKHKSENDPRVTISKEAFRIIANYGKQQALILFVSTADANFRLSLITLDLKLEGKRVTKEFSNPRRYSFFLGPQCKAHTPEQYLSKRVTDLNDLKDRFSIEVVNKEFFTQIALLFTRLTGGTRKIGSKTYDEKGCLKLPDTKDETIKKEFAVRLIGRLIFCWFLKKKTSKADIPLVPADILSLDAITQSKKDPACVGGYYHGILEPLFFELLNTPVNERKKPYRTGSWKLIPFLNGGLFNPHLHDFYELDSGYSKHINTLEVPDPWLTELLDIFETYNFTIDENTPIDVELAIEPEMLGRIFENLLAEINPETGETARKATGSYYTPRPIVEYMVDESLKQYLITKTGIAEDKITSLLSYADEDGKAFTDKQKDALVEALHNVKIIDPACGSGAFPIGVLQKILLMLQKLDPDSSIWLEKMLSTIPDEMYRKELKKKKIPNYLHKLGIIRDCIFGVDIQPIAVEISKLRCFLSLIVDEKVSDDDDNRGIEHLPNLEFKFVCANTLIGLPKLETDKGTLKGKKLVESKGQTSMFEATDKIDELKRLRDEYLSSYGKEKKKIEERFRKVQSEMFSHTLNWGGKDSKTAKLSQWNPFSDEASSWFDPDWMFGIKDGFDAVIANPPYVRVQNLAYSEIDLYKERWSTAWRRIDICTLFFQFACSILNAKGIGCFISSNQFLNTEYGRKVREYFLKYAFFNKIVDFCDLPVFPNQITYVSVFVFRKIGTDHIKYSKVPSLPFLSDALDFTTIPLSMLNSDSWNLTNPLTKTLVHRLAENFITLNTVAKSWAGIITGSDSVLLFKNKDDRLKQFERDLLLSVLRAEGCSRYCYAKPTRTTIYPYADDNGKTRLISERELKQYVNIYEYLKQNRDILISRKDSRQTMEDRGAWYGLVRHGHREIFAQTKIVTPGEVRNNCFALDTTGSAFSCARVFAITVTAKHYDVYFLLGLLNSRLIEFYLHNTAPIKAGGYFSYSSTVLDSIPVPQEVNTDIIGIVKQIMDLRKKDSAYNTLTLERTIDNIVYKLYGLTKAEIEIVENSVN